MTVGQRLKIKNRLSRLRSDKMPKDKLNVSRPEQWSQDYVPG